MKTTNRSKEIVLALHRTSLSEPVFKRLGFRTGMSGAERDTWKASHQEELSDKLKNLLRKYKLPMYLLNFLDWLLLATDEEINQLKAYVRNPRGSAPKAYLYLAKPAFQFGFPFRMGWLTDAGYRLAIMTEERPGHWQIWSSQGSADTRDSEVEDALTFSPVLLKQMLHASGDFLVRGNLDLFDALSWRELGKFLAKVKKGIGMGKPLGLVAGRQKGAVVRRKRILGGMSWDEVQILVAQQPGCYNQLYNEYANFCSAEYVKEFNQSNQGEAPPLEEKRKARKNAILNFARHVKKPVPPHVK